MYNTIFLTDLLKYCESKNIEFQNLTYTEQLAVIRSMLVRLSRIKKL